MSSTIVLVHGAWHGAWCWDLVVEGLRRQGLEVIAVDLPGHGEDDGPLTDLHGDAVAVRSVLDDLAADGEGEREVLLVGHSYGGAVITEAGAHPAVERLVYIAAFCIDDTESCATALADDPDIATVSHEGRPNPADAIVATDDGLTTIDPDQAVEIFYDRCDPATAARAVARLGPHPLLNLGQAPDAVAWREKPAVYVVCDQDLAVHPGLQELMARRCGEVVTWPLDHSSFLSDPDRVVELLAGLAQA